MTSRLHKLGALVLALAGMTLAVVAAPEFTQVDYAGATDTYLWGVSGNYAVGNAYDSNTSTHTAFTYNISGNTFNEVIVPDSNTGSTQAYGISGNKITGSYTDGTGTHGFIYDGATYHTVDVAGASSTAVYGISGNYAVGYSTTSGVSNAFVYDMTNPGAPKITSLGVTGSGTTHTYGFGISGNTIVGYYYDGGVDNAFSYTITGSTFDQSTLDITELLVPLTVGSDGTDANGISGGNIVGYSTDVDGFFHGFVFDGSTYTTVDDTDPNTTDTGLYGVDSETGTAVGFTYKTDGNRHGLVVTAAVVPEPTTYALIALGLLAMGLSRRKSLFASLR